MTVKEVMERLKEYVLDVHEWEQAAYKDGDKEKMSYFRGQTHAYNSAIRLLEWSEEIRLNKK